MIIETDTHVHTVASTHAYSTVSEYFQTAKQKNLKLFAITDHGSAMPDSPHDWHFGNMWILPRVVDNVALLRGIEANILPDNSGLDLPPYPTDRIDLVIASFHSPVYKPQNKRAHTKSLINVIESGQCHIIGHPGNPAFDFYHDEVIKAAAANNVILEINNSSFIHSRPGSKDNCLQILETINKYNWKISFGSDAHIAYALGEFQNCIELVEKCGFPQENVVSATAKGLLDFLAEHGKPVKKELTQWLTTNKL